MEDFWKAAAAALLTVILCLALGKQELSILLITAASCMIGAVALSYLKPVLSMLWELESAAGPADELLKYLLQAAGVCLTSELVGKLCDDAGNSSLGKSMQLLGNAAVLYLSIPIIKTLWDLIQSILRQL